MIQDQHAESPTAITHQDAPSVELVLLASYLKAF